MKKKPLHRISSLLAATVLGLFLLTGCAGKSTEAVQAQEDADTIQVYLWTNSLYEKYAPYVQAQLPDVNIEFIVGNNDLDFYKFLQENGGLPDIITCCRFSLHDAAPLKANGAPPTAIPPAPPVSGWMIPSGRASLRVWSSSSGTPVLRRRT